MQTDLHRTTAKTRWLSPKGFAVATTRGGGESVPATSRHSIMQDGFRTKQNSFIADMKEPYEDPNLDPGFVRSTKEYLK